MNEKFINLRDLSPLQTDLTGLPFGIYDEDQVLLESLFEHIKTNHKEHPNKETILQSFVSRQHEAKNHQAYHAKVFGKSLDEIRIEYKLTRVAPFRETFVQFLGADIVIPLSDSRRRYSFPPVCYILDKDMTTWTEIVQPEELQQKPSADMSAV